MPVPQLCRTPVVSLSPSHHQWTETSTPRNISVVQRWYRDVLSQTHALYSGVDTTCHLQSADSPVNQMPSIMSMSIIDLYSAESWSISTALCVLSGNNEIGSFPAIVWSCCWWAPGHADCPVASSRPSDQRQKRPDDQKCWASNVVRSGDVEWLTENDVGWECLRLV